MFQSLLKIRNVCWSEETFRPATDVDRASILCDTVTRLQGRFACASAGPDGGVMLARDRLGLNKLFLAIHESGSVVVANYLIDLVRRGVPFESVYSVPAGHVLELDSQLNIAASPRYWNAESRVDLQGTGVEDVPRDIRAQLEVWFSRIATQFGRRKICVCLSGGIDSGVIAALAREYFSDVTAYTYAFADDGTATSEDAIYAERLAETIRIPFRLVPASAEDLLSAVENALCYGQDWRDFNVHCAIVNEIVARAIRRDAEGSGSGAQPLVLTGDLANEFLADYTPVQYGGQEYYRLPGITPATLRLVLIRGLDAGDREVGVFNHHGLDVIQPYGFVVDQYLRLPGSCIGGDRSKQTLAKRIAGDLLPGFVFDRVKVRAQIGNSSEPIGILPVLLQNGYDAARLRNAFCQIFNIEHEAFLSRFIRAGRYRIAPRLSGQRSLINGYIAA